MSRPWANFNPRSPHGERPSGSTRRTSEFSFQSTLPARGATENPLRHLRRNNFNPRSPHGERQCTVLRGERAEAISIHAPRTGSDAHRAKRVMPHRRFQSTLPARGATGVSEAVQKVLGDFNPRSPHGERRRRKEARAMLNPFQSTLPARGATWKMYEQGTKEAGFQSTLPARGATAAERRRERCLTHFNPRSPHGERRRAKFASQSRSRFQSTLPARGATWHFAAFCGTMRISIHAPRTGSDEECSARRECRTYFNPRSPHGERPTFAGKQSSLWNFNPRSPHGERRVLSSAASTM